MTDPLQLPLRLAPPDGVRSVATRASPQRSTRGDAVPRAAFVLAILAVVGVCEGCGGAPPPLPTAPTPSVDLPVGGPCGAVGPSRAVPILNGTDCSPDTSAVVLVNARDRNGFAAGACSGTVIAPRHVLTAAHCLADAALIRVWLGSGDEIVARSFTPHPDYRGSGASALDVGVIVMDRELPRAPIPMLVSRDARVGEAAVIAGWGRDLNNVPATLRGGLTTITGVSATLLETIFAGNVSSVCSGDSGGPLLLLQAGVWAIGGVISATSETACNTGTNFYVNLRNPAISSFIASEAPEAAQR